MSRPVMLTKNFMDQLFDEIIQAIDQNGWKPVDIIRSDAMYNDGIRYIPIMTPVYVRYRCTAEFVKGKKRAYLVFVYDVNPGSNVVLRIVKLDGTSNIRPILENVLDKYFGEGQ